MDVPSSNSTASTSITPGYNSSSGSSKVDNRLSADTNILQVQCKPKNSDIFKIQIALLVLNDVYRKNRFELQFLMNV